jgi:hypothetical protein
MTEKLKTAKFVRHIDENPVSDQNLYKLSVSVPYDYDYDKERFLKKTKYVIVSAVIVLGTGPETFIFPADKNGQILDWGELEGSYRGGLNHDKALRKAGFEPIY